jgi:Protein of unknown function (DUF1207)
MRWGAWLFLGFLATPRAARAESAWEWDVGGAGQTVFEHTRASLRDPHFGMRFYCDAPVPGTLNEVDDKTSPGLDARAAAASNSHHAFWDVSFGEHMPVVTRYQKSADRFRPTRGFQLNLDAAVFMLLDFRSQSAGVLDADFRIGLSLDFRVPADGWDHLSLSLGILHESTHLGDEYALSATTIQGKGPPVANPTLRYRANPSYEAVPLTLSVDAPPVANITGRLYVGGSFFFDSSLPNGGFPAEWRVGASLSWWPVIVTEDAPAANAAAPPPGSRWGRLLENLRRRSEGPPDSGETSPSPVPALPSTAQPRRHRGPISFEVAYELLAKRRYVWTSDEILREATFVRGSGDWFVHHVLLMGLYNLDRRRSSSNAFGVSVDFMRGRSPFGQLTEYARLDNVLALGVSYYW